MQITVAVDGGMGHRPAGALGLTWTACPGQRASTEEKRFTDEACGQVIASPSLQLLNSSPLNLSLKLPPCVYLTPPPSSVSSISQRPANRCPVSKTGIMFLEDVLVILVFARLLIIAMLSGRGEDDRRHRGQQVTISAGCVT